MSVAAAGALQQELADAAYSVGWWASRRVPERVAMAAFREVADGVWRRHGRGVVQLEANLARSRPAADAGELRRLSRLAMRSYLRYWAEVFRLPVWSAAEVVGRVRTYGEEPLRKAYAAGCGVVVALPHTANWDHAGAWSCLTGMPVVTVAERLRPDRLFARFLAYRESLGMEVLPLTGAANPLAALASRLRAGRLACLVADRDLSSTGVEVTMLGEPARLPGGPSALSRATGAALFPATLSYDGTALVVRVHDRVPPSPGRAGLVAMTQQVADAFSAGIAAHPQDWHMLQPVFTRDLPAGVGSR